MPFRRGSSGRIAQNVASKPLSRALGKAYGSMGSNQTPLSRKLMSFASTMEAEASKANCSTCQGAWRRMGTSLRAFPASLLRR